MKINLKNNENPNIQVNNYTVVTSDGHKANVFATDSEDAKLSLNSVLKENDDNVTWIGKIRLLNSEGDLIETKTLKIKAANEEQAEKYLNQYILVKQADNDTDWENAEIESPEKVEEVI